MEEEEPAKKQGGNAQDQDDEAETACCRRWRRSFSRESHCQASAGKAREGPVYTSNEDPVSEAGNAKTHRHHVFRKGKKGRRGTTTRRRRESPVHQQGTQVAQGEPEDATAELVPERCSYFRGHASEASAPLAESLPRQQQPPCQKGKEPWTISAFVPQRPWWTQAQTQPPWKVHYRLRKQPRKKEGPQQESPPPPLQKQHFNSEHEHQEWRKTAPPRP
ncbi:uncharacterized protein LOC125942230 [Dermacentor silvarum]|uniref:uncharacterized protein LOC125942230 n=1 Tax=Dermacentor silvarum TaxID=543639 RepID=UPI0021017998|nr:uncharacterized protein LOC125942230 [Dermacentor silvarum]